MVLTNERKGSVNGETVKLSNSFSQLHCFAFAKTNTSKWKGVEKLQLCMMFYWDKKVKRSKRWELDSSGFYSIMSTELDKPQCLLDYWTFIRRRQYDSVPLFRIGLLSCWCLKGSSWLEAPHSPRRGVFLFCLEVVFASCYWTYPFLLQKRKVPFCLNSPSFLTPWQSSM